LPAIRVYHHTLFKGYDGHRSTRCLDELAWMVHFLASHVFRFPRTTHQLVGEMAAEPVSCSTLSLRSELPDMGAISWNSYAARTEPIRRTTFRIRHHPTACTAPSVADRFPERILVHSPPPPFSTSRLTLPSPPARTTCPEPVSRSGLSLARNDCSLAELPFRGQCSWPAPSKPR
jgi:hypothetical protein